MSIVSVSANETNGVIQFDSHILTAVTDVSELQINDGSGWSGCVMLDFNDDYIVVRAAMDIFPGMAWRVLTPLGVVWDDDPAITLVVPESGVVV